MNWWHETNPPSPYKLQVGDRFKLLQSDGSVYKMGDKVYTGVVVEPCDTDDPDGSILCRWDWQQSNEVGGAAQGSTFPIDAPWMIQDTGLDHALSDPRSPCCECDAKAMYGDYLCDECRGNNA